MLLNVGTMIGAARPFIIQNPVPSLDNVINYTDFGLEENYTFSAGVDASAVAQVLGDKSWTASGDPEYSASAFNGLGGVLIENTSSQLQYDSTFSSGAVHTIAMVVQLPDYVSDRSVFSFKWSSNAWLFHDAVGQLTWGKNQANGFPNLYDDVDNAPVLIVMRFNGTGSADVFINSKTAYNFDPKDSYSTNNNIYLGVRGGGDACAGALIGEFLHTEDAMTDEEISQLLNYWDAKYATGFFKNQSSAPRIPLLGDSILNAYFSTGKDEDIRTNLESYYNVAYPVNMSQGGLAIGSSDGSNAFVNSTTGLVSSKYNTFYEDVDNPENVPIVVISLGINSLDSYAADVEGFKTDFQVLIDQLQSDFVNLTKILLMSLGRSLVATNANYQIIRDALKDIATDNAIIDEDMIEYYYLDYNAADVHPDSNGEDTFVTDLSNRLLGELGKIPLTGKKGMQITSVAKQSSTVVRATIEHDGGSSITLPTNAEDFYSLVISGTEYPASSVAVVDSTHIDVTFSTATISGLYDFYYVYADESDTAATSTPYTQDDNGLWLRSAAFTDQDGS